jgi:hypothetical protein
MKNPHISLSLAVVILGCEIASGQGFVNFGFENTTLTGILVNQYSGYYATNATLPGWSWAPLGTFGNGDPNTTVAFNNLALDAPYVTLHGTSDPYGYAAISGKYSILLQGGSQFVSSSSYAAIWQTGQIPANAQSLTYWGGALQVTFNGQPLAPFAIGSGANYTIWGMDISAYAGQVGQLQFTAPWQTYSLIDNIQFSSSPVPEPSILSMLSICFLFVYWSRKRPNKSPEPTWLATAVSPKAAGIRHATVPTWLSFGR